MSEEYCKVVIFSAAMKVRTSINEKEGVYSKEDKYFEYHQHMDCSCIINDNYQPNVVKDTRNKGC